MISLAVCRERQTPVHREVFVGVRAMPDLVVALAVPDEPAAVLLEDFHDLVVEALHSVGVRDGLVLQFGDDAHGEQIA
jgi:hypothetical protein